MHLPVLIQDLAFILGTAASTALLFQRIRQPVVLGYLVAGFIVGPHLSLTPTISDLPNIKVWAELGIIFLMFSLGLEFTFHKLKRVGLSAIITAGVEVAMMLGLGYACGLTLGWDSLDCLFLGSMLCISSTTIIVKAFEEQGVRSKNFAELVIAVLIVEDLIAILLLAGFSSLGHPSDLSPYHLVGAPFKLVLVVGSWFLVGSILIPRFLKYSGSFISNETLTLLSLALCLGLVVTSDYFNYSVALGAFIMGSILAETGEAHRIETLMKPLKDLFAAIFFVSIGMLVKPSTVIDELPTILLVTSLTVVGKIGSTGVGAMLAGQSFRKSVQMGFSLAQIGEFSFILASLGLDLHLISERLYPIAVAVSVVTTFLTPYFIRMSATAADALQTAALPLLSRLAFSDRLFTKFSHQIKRTGTEWELNLVRLVVHPNSVMVGRRIKELSIREQYGVNVVAIQRGGKTRVAPPAQDILFPFDHLLVLGEETLVDRLRQKLEPTLPDQKASHSLMEYALSSIEIKGDSPYKGRTISESRIRSEQKAIIVALERNSKREINPLPSTVLREHDRLWIVSEPS